MGAREAPWANQSSSGSKPVRETNAAAVIPSPDVPSGLEGELTDTHPNTDRGARMWHRQGRSYCLSSTESGIGTWNVGTMYQAGKAHQVARDMKKAGAPYPGR